jgi:hypothetical protein
MKAENLEQDLTERVSSRNVNPYSLGVYDRATIFWSWLFPLSYLIHIAEEYWGGEGYPAYILRLRGVHMSTGRFLAAQSVGFVLVTIGVLLARRLSILSYGPGLVSSIFVWGPLGIATMIRFKSLIDDQRQYWIAIAIGVGVNVVVGILTMRVV